MITAEIRRRVRERAENSCEYCRLQQAHSPLASLQIEHIISLKHGGDDSLDNLALARIDCNLSKGPNIAGIDSVTRRTTDLFHPRRQRRADHFEWNGPYLLGLTAVGRATIEVLRINSEEQVQLRASLASHE